MKLTKPQRACLAYYLWLENREGPKPKWNHDVRVENGLLDKQLLASAWVKDESKAAKAGFGLGTVKKVTVTAAGKAALEAT